MKKFCLIIILFFNIVPIWKNGNLYFLQLGTIKAQTTTVITPGTVFGNASNLLNFCNNLPNHNNFQNNICCSGTGVVSHNLSTGAITHSYLNQNAGTIVTALGTTLPPTAPPPPPDEFPSTPLPPDPEIPDIIPFDITTLWPLPGGSGNEGVPPTIPVCTEEMLWPQMLYEFSEAEGPAFMYPQLFMNTPNLPCTNNILMGGNIINFPPDIANSIGQYNFEDNCINAIKLNNATNDVFNRMVRYDVMKITKILDANDPTYCRATMGSRLIFQNQRGIYKFVCLLKFGSASFDLVGEIPTGEFVLAKENIPANLTGIIFTLPPTSITPAQSGNSVLGVNSSNALSCQTLDCAKVANGTATIDNCGACTGGTTGTQPCSQTPSNTNYYTTLNNDTTKYYKNDTIYVPQRNVQIKLTIHKVGGTLAATDLIWKRKDTTKCTNVIECFVMPNTLGVTVIRVDSGTSLLIKNPLAIYKVPTLYFKRGLNYVGEYGFDDSAQWHPLILNNPRYASGTIKKTYGQDANYHVPWMSLLDNQTVTIRDSIANLSSEAKKDKNGYVEFRQSIVSNNKIIMYGSNNPKFYYSSLNKVNSFNIHARKWAEKIDSLRKIGNFNNSVSNIYAITNNGDTIGQMKLTCDIPTPKKIVFVYVNTGNGYRNISKQLFLDSLNKNTHNQILRKWVLDPAFSSNGRDTINLTHEFNQNTAKFMNGDTLIKQQYINQYYLNHKNYDIKTDLNSGVSVNTDDSNKIHVVFIFNYSILVNGAGTIAIAQVGGFTSLWWSTATYKEIGHEMGHILKLKHTDSQAGVLGLPAPGYRIPAGTTNNLMEPDKLIPDPAEMFYFAQWVDCY
jgi:hypothetical protein